MFILSIIVNFYKQLKLLRILADNCFVALKLTRVLKLIATGYQFFPVLYFVLGPVLFDIPAEKLGKLALSLFFWIACFWAVFSGTALKGMKRWGWHAFIAGNIVISIFNLHVIVHYSDSHHKYAAFSLVSLCIALLVFRTTKELRVPYFLPNIRWWESDPRYKFSVPAHVIKDDGSSIDGQIMDISVSGCFVKIKELLSEEQYVQLEFQAFQSPVVCKGVVVWKTESSVTHPRGIGIKFDPFNRQQRKLLATLIDKVRKTFKKSA